MIFRFGACYIREEERLRHPRVEALIIKLIATAMTKGRNIMRSRNTRTPNT